MSTGGRRLTAIVFTDIVGYSALVHRDEALGARLLDRQREVVRRIVPQHDGREIETAGDSFLLEFGSTLAAVEAVLAIQKELAAINEIAPEDERVVLRSSVHLGDIEHRGKEVYGDGVNIAARLMPLAPPGGIALSGQVYGSVRQRLQFPARSIGTPTLKNIETPVEVFLVDLAPAAEESAQAPTPVPEFKLGEKSDPQPAYRRRWAVPIALAALATVMVVGYLGLSSQPVVALDKSVAVLPFKNMSDNNANAYFADGMQDEILTNLSRIRDLKVISRTSVERYRGQIHDLRSIAKELDVATVVEGSVQRIEDRVRINVQLIDASNDAHLWAERYDRELTDVFAVQSEIAKKIASSLKATLLPSEAQAIAATPTQNPKAYDLYLRAQRLSRSFHDDYEWHEDDVPRAVSALEQAVTEDPDFALGWAELAKLEMDVYWFGPTTYKTAERRERARAAADRSLALQPDLGEAHFAMALYYYWGHLDYESALRELELARDSLPGSAVLASTAGAIKRRQGHLEESLDDFRRATVLDPKRSATWQGLSSTLLQLGHLDEARLHQDRAVALSDTPRLTRVVMSANLAHMTGELDHLRKAIKALPPPGSGERKRVVDIEFYLRMHAREYEQAEELLRQMDGDWLEVAQVGVPVAYLRAGLARARGDREAEQEAHMEARALLEAAVADGNEALTGVLAQTYAGLGLREQAIEMGERRVDDQKKDAWAGPYAVQELALMHLLLGDKEPALSRLEEFEKLQLVVCGGCFLDPDWDPLRDDPRFQAVADKLSRVKHPAR